MPVQVDPHLVRVPDRRRRHLLRSQLSRPAPNKRAQVDTAPARSTACIRIHRRRIAVAWVTKNNRVLGVFDALFPPTPTAVAHVQHLQQAGQSVTKVGGPSSVDVSDTQLRTRCGVFSPEDHLDPVQQAPSRTPYSPVRPDSFIPVISSDVAGINVGYAGLSSPASHPVLHRVRQVGRLRPDFLVDAYAQ